jgi:aldose 1-epimerase
VSVATRRPRRAVAPSGEQFEISSGEQRATIVEVGGGLRAYEVGGRPVLDPYPLGEMCDGAHGTPLIPWPNRLRDGRYSFEGEEHQVSLSEPERHNAIHGFLRWRPWRAVERKPDRVTMGITLHPQSGYPFALDVRIGYELGSDGLLVTTSVTNIGASACPFGCGQHPYLSPGGGTIDACELTLPARTRILTDPERMLPCGREEVTGGPLDFTAPRAIGELQVDSAFTDLLRGEDGRAVARLAGPDGSVVELWVDESYGYLELYTADGLAPERRRRGLGVEPMTCPPDAFRSGEGLLRLAPGEEFTAHWGVRLRSRG